MAETMLNPDAVAALFRPTADAIGLPGRAYASEGWWQAERERWFKRGWMAIAFESDVPRVGDMWPVDVAGWSLLMVRSAIDEIAVFHNICAHRGMKLVDSPTRGARIVCPWHCWTYDLNGAIARQPHIGGPDINQGGSTYAGLKRVRAAAWGDIVYVNLSDDAEPFEDFIAPLKARFADYDLSEMRFSGLNSDHSFEANWKLVIEGGIEDYHLPWVHPQEGLNKDNFTPEFDDRDCYVGFSSRYAMTREANSLRNPQGEGELPLFSHLARYESADGLGPECGMFVVPPSAVYWLLYNMFIPTLILPLGPNATRQRRSYHFIGDAATDPLLSAKREAVRTSWESISAQDTPIAIRVQALQHQRDEAGIDARFSAYWERAVHHFQQMTARRMGLIGGEAV